MPVPDKGPLILETDAYASAIGCAITQAGKPTAFFSRSLSKSKKVSSSVEKGALAIVESIRKYDNLLKRYGVLVKTDMRIVAFIFADSKFKVKNEKLMRWRLELAEFQYDISYKAGRE